jgi:hypothetical protein
MAGTTTTLAGTIPPGGIIAAGTIATLAGTIPPGGIIAAPATITTLISTWRVITPVARIVSRLAITRPLRCARDKNGPVDTQEDDVVASQYNVPDRLLVFHGYDWNWLGFGLVGRGLRLESFFFFLLVLLLFGHLEILVPHVLQVHVQVFIESSERTDIALVSLNLDGHGPVQVQVEQVKRSHSEKSLRSRSRA